MAIGARDVWYHVAFFRFVAVFVLVFFFLVTRGQGYQQLTFYLSRQALTDLTCVPHWQRLFGLSVRIGI